LAEVPTVTAPRLVPPPEISPQIAAEPGETLAHLGQEFGAVADYGVEVAGRIRRAQADLALAKAKNEIEAAYNKFQETLSQSGDPDNLPNPQTFIDNLKNSYEGKPKYADPMVKRALDLHVDAVGEDARHLTLMRQLSLQRGQFIEQLTLAQENAAFKMANDTTPEDYARDRGDFEHLALAGESSGWITAKEHALYMRRLDAAAQDHRITNAIISQNPSQIQTMIDETTQHPEHFKELEEKRFQELRAHLNVAFREAKRLKDEDDVRAQGDPILVKDSNDVTLKDPRTGRTDWRQAIERLDQDNTIPEKVKDYVRPRLRARAEDQRAALTTANREVITHFKFLAETGSLNSQQIQAIEQQIESGQIEEDVGLAIVQADDQIKRQKLMLTMDQRRFEREQREVRSADLAQKILMDAHGGYIPEEELQKYAGDLTHADYNFLAKTTSIKSDPAWRQAVAIVQTSPTFGDLTIDANKIEMSKFLQTLERTVEANHLTGEGITDELSKELKARADRVNQSFISQWFDRIWSRRFATPKEGEAISGATMPTIQTPYSEWTEHGQIVEQRQTKDGRILSKYQDGTIR
jgi:hypothetical protein